MKKISIIFIIVFFLSVNTAFADDAAIQNALGYLKSQQDASGKIITGFSAPSQWSAIAFTSNGIDMSTIKKYDTSLHDFLLTDLPTNDTATEWETRALAIVATHENPTNVNGTNYVSHIQSFYNNNQIGDTCSVNDDIFGLLALIASGSTADITIKQNTLHFIIKKQDTTDGGFGFSAPGCPWYGTSADMTGAGLQALIAAKNNSLTDPNLDAAITKAKGYIATNQNSDGGFGYFGSSDTDTTGWVLIGLNAAGMQDSDSAKKAKAYLLSQQSATDGGFIAFDYGTNTFQSNTTTTAQSIIALSGNTWILQVFQLNPSITPTATSSATLAPTPSPTLTPTPTAGLTSISQNELQYKTITITTTPAPKKKITSAKTKSETQSDNEAILGVTNMQEKQSEPKTTTSKILVASAKNPGFLFTAIGMLFLAGFFLFRNKFKKHSF